MDPKREKDRKSKKSRSFLNVQAVRQAGRWVVVSLRGLHLWGQSGRGECKELI